MSELIVPNPGDSLWVPPEEQARLDEQLARKKAQATLRRELGLPEKGGPSARELQVALGRDQFASEERARRRKAAKRAKQSRKRNR